jgi:hypothetical protein
MIPVGWNGTLNYLESGTGYMIKSSKEQSFTYPSYLAKAGKFNRVKPKQQLGLDQETISPEFAVCLQYECCSFITAGI